MRACCSRTSQQCPNQIWVGDFTYITTDADCLYLAVVMDLFLTRGDGLIVMADRMTAAPVCDVDVPVV